MNMNPISEEIKIGTIGEILVQLRLLQYNVQSAPALKDSGNDLIAVRGEIFKAIQVKTSTKEKFNLPHYKKPSIFTYSTVWATAVKENEPFYALYDGGTNRLVVLRYIDKWEEIKLEEVENLYGLIWKMVAAHRVEK